MSYRNNAGYPVQDRINVPFAELLAPFAFVGEAAYTAMGAAARGVGKAVRACLQFPGLSSITYLTVRGSRPTP
jgi:hypothetical protein